MDIQDGLYGAYLVGQVTAEYLVFAFYTTTPKIIIILSIIIIFVGVVAGIVIIM